MSVLIQVPVGLGRRGQQGFSECFVYSACDCHALAAYFLTCVSACRCFCCGFFCSSCFNNCCSFFDWLSPRSRFKRVNLNISCLRLVLVGDVPDWINTQLLASRSALCGCLSSLIGFFLRSSTKNVQEKINSYHVK